MRIVVVGTGYVGLVTGAGLADFGNDVVCVDTDEDKIKKLYDGVMPIYEDGLEALVKRGVASKRLSFSTNLGYALLEFKPEIVMIAVGTPSLPNGDADLSSVWDVASTIARNAQQFTVVVNKSTVPVGTGARVKRILEDTNKEVKFSVVSCPEFLKEGRAVEDMLRPDRVVIGADRGDDVAFDMLYRLYLPFLRTAERLLRMGVRSAELTKYAANAMLATRISFMNELALLADAVNADIGEVREGIGSDPRIGDQFLYAGCGWGGGCFRKDLSALVSTARSKGLHLRVPAAALATNEQQQTVVPRKLLEHFNVDDLSHMTIAVWGLSFKPLTDDARESPAVNIVEQLLRLGADVRAYDPMARYENSNQWFTRVDDMYEACEGADALVLVTEWREFRQADFGQVVRRIKHAVVVDGRNVLDRFALDKLGFAYYGIGR